MDNSISTEDSYCMICIYYSDHNVIYLGRVSNPDHTRDNPSRYLLRHRYNELRDKFKFK